MFKGIITVIVSAISLSVHAQTSDSLIANTLRESNIRFSHDNSVTLLLSGQEKFDDMFRAIRQAKSSIHLEYFNFRNDSIASLLFDLLREKRKEGVEVRAMFDGFGNDSNNQPLKKYHLKALRDDSIDIVEYSPIRFPWVNHIFGRDHRKIVVIDGQIAYTGGMNVADYYIKGTEQVGEWRDMHCRIEGDAVNELQAIFMRIWNRSTGQQVSGMKYYRGGTLTRFDGLKPDTTCTKGRKMVGIINREPGVTPKIMRTFYISTVPEAIIESARIDGSGEWRTLLQIVAPLAVPGFATVALFSAIGVWNDFRNCLLINDSAKYYNLQYTIYQTMNNLRFLKENASRMGGVNVANLPAETFRMAMAVVTVGPIIMAYPFFQKYFVKGLTVGAVKG